MAWKGWRKTLEISDLWPLNDKDTSDFLIPEWEEQWQGAIEKCWGKRKSYRPPPPKPTKVLEINGQESIPLDEKREKKKEKKPSDKPVLSDREKGILKCAPSLSLHLIKLFLYPLFLSAFLQLIVDCLKFSNPLLLK